MKTGSSERERGQEGSHQLGSRRWHHTPLCIICYCFSPNTLNSVPSLSRTEPQDRQAQDPESLTVCSASLESNTDWFRDNLESFQKMIKHLSQTAGKLYIMFTRTLKKRDEEHQKLLLTSHTQIKSLGFNFSPTNKTYLVLQGAGRSETIRKAFQTVKLTKRWYSLVTLTKLVSNCFLHDLINLVLENDVIYFRDKSIISYLQI